jgi:hypothetical protein
MRCCRGCGVHCIWKEVLPCSCTQPPTLAALLPSPPLPPPLPAPQLASNADLYVNDAFGTAHRAHASTEGVTKYLKPSVAGFLLQKVRGGGSRRCGRFWPCACVCVCLCWLGRLVVQLLPCAGEGTCALIAGCASFTAHACCLPCPACRSCPSPPPPPPHTGAGLPRWRCVQAQEALRCHCGWQQGVLQDHRD